MTGTVRTTGRTTGRVTQLTAVVEPLGSGLRGALRDAAPLLLSVGLLMAGNGLTSTLIGTRAGLEGMNPTTVGLVLAGFYVGFVGGSLFAPTAIVRVGHVRVFSGLASLASGAVLVHVVQTSPVTWFFLRAVSGVCISALYVVCETWLNGTATNRTRGGLLASYMVAVSVSQLTGQILFSVSDPSGFGPFVLASVLVSLAVVPVSLASYPAPPVPSTTPLSLRRLVTVAPLGAVGALISGFIGAAMLGAGVVFAAEAGFNRLATGAFVGAALVGGALLQVPLGAWSDRIDRRAVIATTAFVAAGVAIAASTVPTDRRVVLIALVTVAGGATFPIYSLSSAHLNDHLEPALVVAGGARLVLVNGVGAVAGPIVGGAAVGRIGPPSLFLVMAAGYLLIGGYAVYRMTRRPAVSEAERVPFVPVPVGVGPSPVPRPDGDVDEAYPPVVAAIDVDGTAVTYRDQGVGAAVVLLDDTIRVDRWTEVAPALVLDGVRAITVHTGPPGLLDDDHVVASFQALLRHLELPSATVVGGGSVAGSVRRLVEEHPDRIESGVVVCPLDTEPPEEPARPMLIVDLGHLDDDPEGLADDIAEFVRRLPEAADEDGTPHRSRPAPVTETDGAGPKADPIGQD